jgi:hypothetical protein
LREEIKSMGFHPLSAKERQSASRIDIIPVVLYQEVQALHSIFTLNKTTQKKPLQYEEAYL